MPSWADRTVRHACLIAVAMSLGFAGSVQGQPRGGPHGPGEGPAVEELRETLTILMMVRMKRELGLSQEQYERILPRVEEMETERQKGAVARRDLLARLRALLMQDAPPAGEITEVVDRISALEEADHRRERAFFAEVRKALSPKQQGEFVLFRQRFRGWVEERMREMREMRRGAGGPPGAPARGRREGPGPGVGAGPGSAGPDDR